MCVCVFHCAVVTGSRPEDDLMALASGPWGVEYRLLALCSAAAVLQIWLKYPAGTEFISGLDTAVPKSSVFTAPPLRIFILRWVQCTAVTGTVCRAAAGETPLGIRIIFFCKLNQWGVKRSERNKERKEKKRKTSCGLSVTNCVELKHCRVPVSGRLL